jgi:5-methylcytosine-specific restriction protein A
MTRFKVGQEYRRQDLHAEYGGQRQGGISTPAKHPIIFLFSTPSGQQYGYTDSWQGKRYLYTGEGQEGDRTNSKPASAMGKRYLYTGEGQEGDMTFTRGNKAIRDHGNKEIHVFEFVRPGIVRYVGEFKYDGFHLREGRDIRGHLRKVIVFELIPVEVEGSRG